MCPSCATFICQISSTVLVNVDCFPFLLVTIDVVSHCPLQVERSRAKQPQQAKKKGEEEDKELAPPLDNSIAWGGFVATSTNARYQLVNGFEERALVSHLLDSRLAPFACSMVSHAAKHDE